MPQINIVARGQLKFDDGQFADGEQLQVSGDQALKCILAGQAVLSRHQAHPPSIALDAFENAVSNLESFGPALTKATTLDRFQSEILGGGPRLLSANGAPLNWIEGFRQLIDCGFTERTLGSISLSDLKQQLIECSKLKMPKLHGLIEFDVPRGEITATERAIGYLAGAAKTETRRHSPQWVAFLERVYHLMNHKKSIVQKAMSEARILAVERNYGASRLIPPAQASKLSADDHKDRQSEFLFSRDLKAWLKHEDMSDASATETDALEWLNREIDIALDRGKSITKNHAEHKMKQRFGIVRRRAKVLIAQAWPTQWNQLKNRPKSEKYFPE